MNIDCQCMCLVMQAMSHDTVLHPDTPGGPTGNKLLAGLHILISGCNQGVDVVNTLVECLGGSLVSRPVPPCNLVVAYPLAVNK